MHTGYDHTIKTEIYTVYIFLIKINDCFIEVTPEQASEQFVGVTLMSENMFLHSLCSV